MEECCSALHVEEKAKRIQLVPKHNVCLCLCTVFQGMLIRVDDGEVAIPSHTHIHTQVKHKVALSLKRVGAIKRRAGFSLPLISPSLFRPIYLSVTADGVNAFMWVALFTLRL